MDLIQKANKLGYKHYTEFTVEELDNLSLENSNKQIEYYFIQKWLREKYNIYIFIYTMESLDGLIYFDFGIKQIINWLTDKSNKPNNFDTYEEALEKGLQEALKLI